MASSRRFAIRLALRLLLLLAVAGAAAESAALGDAPMTTFLSLCGVGLATASIWQLVNEVNLELTRFVTALERAELGVSFPREGRGASFDRLGAAYERVVERLRDERASGVGATRYADALVDGSPTSLLVIGPGEEVRFANKAARRLFGRDAPSTLDALAPFGRAAVDALRAIAPGRTATTHMVLDGLSQRIALDATSIDVASGRRRVVSVRTIQSELNDAELAAQIDLVRVLTHEVMNSLTPVTSLAGTAVRLIGEVDPAWSPSVGKAQRAITALARRAGELERFVESYKDFSASPTLSRGRVNVAGWFEELARLYAAMPAANGVSVSWPEADTRWTIDVDQGLMTQVMLNVLKNAGEAVAESEGAAVTIEAMATASDRLRIVVADNGPGLDPAIAQDAFLPFFTTKADGTGIGLSFARKVVLLHGGQIGFADGPGGRVELLLALERAPRRVDTGGPTPLDADVSD